MTLEGKVVSLVANEGQVRSDALKSLYKERYGKNLVQQGKLTKWLENIQELQVINGVIEVNRVPERVRGILRSNEGSMTLSALNQQYRQHFGKPPNIDSFNRPYLLAIPDLVVMSKKVSLSNIALENNQTNEVESQEPATPETASSTEACSVISDIPNMIIPNIQKLFIDSEEALYTSRCIEKLLQQAETVRGRFAVVANLELFNSSPSILSIGTHQMCVTIDCKALAWSTVFHGVLPFMQSRGNWMAVNDISTFSLASQEEDEFGPVLNVLDMQLITELWTGKADSQLDQVLLRLKTIQSKTQVPRLCLSNNRPLPQKVLEDCVTRFQLLYQAAKTSINSLTESDLKLVLSAAQEKVNNGKGLWFDENKSYQVASYAMLQARNSEMTLSFQPQPLEIIDEFDNVLELLPSKLQNGVRELGLDGLAEFAFDVGREPLAWKLQKRIILSKDLVTEDDISDVVEKLGGFGTDNRAGIERQLHRISCIRNRSDDIIGLTFRLGRHVTGIADMIADLLFSANDKSILFLGEPGCGKTTIVRGATNLLAREQNVCIVDTSNEIAGDGAVPHSCVGYARRMMVKTLNDQANAMVECVQNHTPEVIVIDEIGRPLEVDAALTCKQRGVRMVASAHGDLRKLIKNRKLRGLIGGVESVTLGDSAAIAEAKRKNSSINNGLSKVKSQRGGEPVFDIIVELTRGNLNEWCIVHNVANAVDVILDGGQYEVERRVRNPKTGTFQSFEELH